MGLFALLQPSEKSPRKCAVHGKSQRAHPTLPLARHTAPRPAIRPSHRAAPCRDFPYPLDNFVTRRAAKWCLSITRRSGEPRRARRQAAVPSSPPPARYPPPTWKLAHVFPNYPPGRATPDPVWCQPPLPAPVRLHTRWDLWGPRAPALLVRGSLTTIYPESAPPLPSPLSQH